MFIKKRESFILFIGMWFFISCNKEPLPPLSPFTESCAIFAHRVNTIEELKTLLTYYKGVELDVHFDNSTKSFFIKHDAEDPSILTLEDYFQVGNANKELKYWLDFKNLDDVALELVQERLEKLDDLYKIKNKIIIESWNHKRLSSFSKQGYYTSYWTEDVTSSIEDSIQIISKLKEILTKYQFNALSCKSTMYEVYNEKFPQYVHHYWTRYGVNEHNSIEKLCASSKTGIILVDDRTLY